VGKGRETHESTIAGISRTPIPHQLDEVIKAAPRFTASNS
jgi:hypothetical protein